MKPLTETNVLHHLKTGVCALALAGCLVTLPVTAAYADEKVTTQATAEVKQGTQDQMAEKRKEIMTEAVTALQETRNALKALDDNKTRDALAALEKATGKLEIIPAREPELALAPTGVTAVTHDILGSLEAVKTATAEAGDLLEDGRVQEARHLLRGLASETVISTTNLPLATYPAAIKKAVRLIDEDKTKEAKVVLQTALNTLVVTNTVIPLPVVTAESLLEEAEKLAENKERTEEESIRLNALLNAAQTEIEFAQALGYGTKKDFNVLYEELDLIREKTGSGKSGFGFFDKIQKRITSMFKDSQLPDEQQEARYN